MEIYLVDYDKNFTQYLEKWVTDNMNNYKNSDDMEMDMPNVYTKWLNTPASWLNNKTPGSYFKQFDDAHALVKLLLRYISTGTGIPEPLMDRIIELSDESIPVLKQVFTGEIPLQDNRRINEVRTLIVNLLAEMDDNSLLDEYAILLTQPNIEDSLVGVIIERLSMESQTKDILLNTLKEVDNNAIIMRFIDILVNFYGDSRILKWILYMFERDESNTALLASYLGKYGDEAAIPYLREALDYEDINYLDYLEVRNAIEELGEIVEHVREFDGDSYYESLKGLDGAEEE